MAENNEAKFDYIFEGGKDRSLKTYKEPNGTFTSVLLESASSQNGIVIVKGHGTYGEAFYKAIAEIREKNL